MPPEIETEEKNSAVAVEEKAPETPPVKKEAVKEHEPPPQHERFKEVYGKMKDYERQLQESQRDIDALREHNKGLAAKMEEIDRKNKYSELGPEPDPGTDPEGYKKWRDLKDALEETKRAESERQERLDRQIEIQKDLHEDYIEKAQLAEKLMARDPKIRSEITKSDNPPRTAYRIAQEYLKEQRKVEDEEKELKRVKSQTEVESSGPEHSAEEKEEKGLSEDQKRVARNLFPDIPFDEAQKKYKSQLKAMGRA